MYKTLRISFSLKNTYRVNSILYSLKQIPLLKRLLPAALYRVRGLKVFANVLSVLWEIISIFLGKLLYVFVMVGWAASLYEKLPPQRVFLHILLLLTIIGGYANTDLFNPTKDKYYAVILMRMDARAYTLVNYIYGLLKTLIGFLPFIILLGWDRSVPLWLCIALPFAIVGMKLCFSGGILWQDEKKGWSYNENMLSKFQWGAMGLLLLAAYGLPVLGITLPTFLSALLFLACIPLGVVGLWKIVTFKDYRAVNKELLSGLTNQMDTPTQVVKKANEKNISADVTITSSRRGFEYLNELFVKRHRKILWNSTKKISFVCLCLVAGVQVLLHLKPETMSNVNRMIMNWLPYFVFIMYAINRGTGFTQALFMNCDHSLLTYSFYKRPGFVLRLFRIRLWEIMKINAVPALVIGGGLALTLYTSGGTDDPMNYAILIVSILCMSLFFSVHYLTIYYLLQPYNAGTEIKSGSYQIIMSGTYLVCFFLMQQRMPIKFFGMMTIVFCVLYCIVASILVYCFAPKTFKIRT